jgi:tRNA/tmRNA/rRNA uracil-C5-methylase (TrmA/RlmC/RlmD family)
VNKLLLESLPESSNNILKYTKLISPSISPISPSIKSDIEHLIITGGENKFIKFMYTMYENKIKVLNKKLKEIEYIRKNYDKVMDNIDPYITTLINNGIEYCNKHNIKYNKFYDDFKLLNHKKFVNQYFKKINDVNLNNVKISLDANYSITLPIAVEKIANVIRREMPSVQYIIDGNANIGSTGIYLSTFFRHVYSVEVVKSTFDILVHNIKEYHFEKKITPFHDSIINFMKNCNKNCHKFNIDNYCLFLDPPWSGVFYKTETVIDLFFSNGSDGDLNIIDFIKSLKLTIKYVCIKVPNNYNFSALYSAFYKITIHRLNGFYFVLLII